MSRLPICVLWLAALLTVLVQVGPALVDAPERRALDHASGVWIAHATDLADGQFYRPLESDAGYGGSRYAPLQFVLHASLIRAGLGPVAAGCLLILLSALALVLGAYCLLRRLGVPAPVAVPAALLALSSGAAGFALTTVRGDLLPAALNIWGLALCASLAAAGVRRRRLLAAALLFAAAVLAKPTSVSGLLAAFLALLLSARKREACRLLAASLVLTALAAVAVQVASSGRAWESFSACAAGGFSVGNLLRAPALALTKALLDPVSLVLVVLSVAGLLSIPKAAWRDLPTLALAAGLLLLIPIFSIEGTTYNHLVDVSVLGLVFLITQAVGGRLPVAVGVLAPALAVIAVLSTTGLRAAPSPDSDLRARGEVVRLIRTLDAPGHPVLCENPLLPVLAGQRPYLLDPFLFRILSQKNPGIASSIRRQLAARRLSAVILERDPTRLDAWYRRGHLGEAFIRQLLDHYELAAVHGTWFIYRPKKRSRRRAVATHAEN